MNSSKKNKKNPQYRIVNDSNLVEEGLSAIQGKQFLAKKIPVLSKKEKIFYFTHSLMFSSYLA